MKKIVFAQAVMLIFFGLAQVVSGQNAPPAAAGRHKVQVKDRALGQQMAAGGARLIADYDGYQLYDAPASMTNFPPDKAELRDDYNLILLNANRLDTTRAEVKALRTKAGNFAGQRLHLVQFAGPVQPDWRQALLETGAQIVNYIPQNSYLIYGDAAAIARVQALAAAAPHVQWEGAYLNEYKIHPAAQPGQVKTDQFAIQLMADDAANAATLKLIDQLKLAPLARRRRVLNFVNVVVRVPPARLAQIAARPDVISIQPYATPRKLCERQDQIVAGNLSGNAPTGPGYLAWLESHGFSQSQFGSFSVDVSDSGIDDGTTRPNHFGFYVGGIINSTNSRVIYNRLEGTPSPGSTLVGCDGHGNINAHIVGGYDDRSGFPFADSAGYHYGLGVCPFVSLGSSVIFDPTNFTDPSYEDLMSQAYQDGARISNNSWGDSGDGEGPAPEDGLYTLDSQEYDSLVRDAQPEGSAYPAAGNQEMVIVFAAGNDGDYGPYTISSPATGKNIIAVGAAENVQPFGGANDGADLGGTPDAEADNANAIADFSAQGPCADGRQKPDLVAPGTHVSGGAPQAAKPGPDGTAELCFLDNTTNSIGVDGGSDGKFFFPDTGQQFYTASSGTSHSTPCVSGGCALLRQYFINQGWTPPSPAMTKAWLMNAARYMTGMYADDTLWSPNQGMGEMNLGTAFDGTPRLLRDEVPGDMFTASGETRVFNGVIANSTEPFRVTVAWTDAPGSTTGAAYNNDLDLIVTVGGNTYKGNVFNGAYSSTGGSADPYDNVESVFLPAGISGDFTVTIAATSINSVGVPGAAGAVNQDFALVVYNAGQAPVLAAGGALLTLETCTPTNGTINPGEAVTVDLTIQNAGSASTTNLVATLVSGNGITFPSGPQTYGALAPGSAATAAYSFQAEGACGGIITATLQLQDGSASLGMVSYNFQLGQWVATTNFSQNFDSVTPPGLPAGWTTSDSEGKGVVWSTKSGVSVSPPHAVYCPDSAFVDVVYLTSTNITLPGGPCQLSFQQNFNLEDTYDGGVLQISIGGSAFEDILTAGGSFVTGGYVEQITPETPRFYEDPLASDLAWSGTSDGFMTTLVNLPTSAQGQTIQLRWACGTDFENADLVGTGGWWIDNIAIFQTNWSCCNSAATAVPVIVSPVNGYISTTTSVTLTGTTLPNESLTLSDNGNSNETITAFPSGSFIAQAELSGGANVLVLTEAGTGTASTPVTVYFLPPTPTLQVAAVSAPAVAVSGSGVAADVVNILTNGVLAANLTNNASGNYAGSITLPDGTYSISASETTGGVTSLPSAATTLKVLTVQPPVILYPPSSGLLTNNGSLTVKGTGIPGAKVSVYDDGMNLPGVATVSSSGAFNLAVKLPNGTNGLTAAEVSGGISSSPSAAVLTTVILQPVITSQPQSLNGFLKETVTFTTGVYGATPLHIWWEKNGTKISGATTTNLTLSGLVSNSAASYVLIASNTYGAAASEPAVLTLVTNPFSDLTGSYYGLFAQTNAQSASSGFLNLTLAPLGSFSGSILNAGGPYGFSGAFSVTGQAQVSVSRGAKLTPLIVNMNLDLTPNGTEQILGTVSNASWSALLQADRATFGPTNLFPYAGKFTMLFGNTSSGSLSPGGDGYGTVSITTAGLVSWSGVLADNTSAAPSAVSISKYGQWPLYVPLYGTLGSLAGWITVTNPGAFTGEANWFRVGPSGKLYPAGFTNALSIAGSAFTAGTSKIPVLSSTNIVLTLSGGGLSTILTNALTLYNTGKFVTNSGDVSKLTISVTPGTGVISGTFLDPQTKQTTTFKGVVLQQPDAASGFFLATNATGLLLLTSPQP